MGASLASPTTGQRLRRALRWVALLTAGLAVMWYDDRDVTNIAIAFLSGVLLAEDVLLAWQNVR